VVEQQAIDLVVMGVKTRAGEGLSFGHNTALMLEATPCSFLLVSS
jgi:nucleotide-binding universal stress UspA family protein